MTYRPSDVSIAKGLPSRSVSADVDVLMPERTSALTRQVLTAETSADPAKLNFQVQWLAANGDIAEKTFRAPALPLLMSAFCGFARGTLVMTTEGQRAIEDLLPGDMIETASGDPAPVQWIGMTTLPPHSARLVRVSADTFGTTRPMSCLTFGQGARLLQTPDHLRAAAIGKQLLTPIGRFIDGVSVFDVRPPAPVQLFHLCLSRHAVIQIGGLEVETFHPGTQALREISISQRELFLSLFPHISHPSEFGPLAAPRSPDTLAS